MPLQVGARWATFCWLNHNQLRNGQQRGKGGSERFGKESNCWPQKGCHAQRCRGFGPIAYPCTTGPVLGLGASEFMARWLGSRATTVNRL